MKIDSKKVLKDIREYYSDKIITYGKTPKGVDWKDKESQEIRFEQLLKLLDCKQGFSLNDLGCGFGSLFEYMKTNGYTEFKFKGYDLSEDMIVNAKELEKMHPKCSFSVIKNANEISIQDYTVASGIFNVKMGYSEYEWLSYILETIDAMNNRSTKGFSFNVLTKYSDLEHMRSDLYYADPLFIFDFCKRNYSKNVSLLHDYNLYEFTLIIKK